ncbi:MAG: methyltransferase [Flavobacterium sp. BFFFF1]|uniref:methyltransferase domain-containing protein n=1 Tax=Flavobacterium sp. BFFFF1 TaxID=2015557 RepID=UPI000BD54E1D|nr:methyltransferase domain-containing protein [Flavobacterium sp. BFFFF1]OYU79036.1 MAG: methyltransferase [Flavobacterium sp. BFFFF1]
MQPNTKYRSDAPEVMDDFNLEGEILRDALDKIAGINQWLGGNKVILNGIDKLIGNVDTTKEIRICDIGCGNGDMLRSIADYGLINNLKFKLTGIDANNFTINHARKLSVHYPNVDYRCEDVFKNEMASQDIIICTLTLHHFKDHEILQLIKKFYEKCQIGIIINDLERSALAYRLFQIVCFVFRLNKMSKDDGLVSILRGFRKKELVGYSEKLNLQNYTIRWKWAFRYQWIISKI